MERIELSVKRREETRRFLNKLAKVVTEYDKEGPVVPTVCLPWKVRPAGVDRFEFERSFWWFTRHVDYDE